MIFKIFFCRILTKKEWRKMVTEKSRHLVVEVEIWLNLHTIAKHIIIHLGSKQNINDNKKSLQETCWHSYCKNQYLDIYPNEFFCYTWLLEYLRYIVYLHFRAYASLRQSWPDSGKRKMLPLFLDLHDAYVLCSCDKLDFFFLAFRSSFVALSHRS